MCDVKTYNYLVVAPRIHIFRNICELLYRLLSNQRDEPRSVQMRLLSCQSPYRPRPSTKPMHLNDLLDTYTGMRHGLLSAVRRVGQKQASDDVFPAFEPGLFLGVIFNQR
jgi:hypothetical protein